MSAILQVSDLAVSYGQIAAVKGIDLVLHEGEITALVGANGAGKSTALLAISGLLKSVGGQVMFDGTDLTKLAPHKIVGLGIVQVAEGRAILTTLTVGENLALGTYARKDKSGVAKDLEWVFALFPVLKKRRDGMAGNLSGGEQQMLAIGRALMAKPRVLLLDEPSMGLAPILVEEVFRIISDLKSRGVTMLLVEQFAAAALKVADYGYVLENGRITVHGEAASLRDDPAVKAAYLGGGH